jgi:hypothetical protein
MPLHLFILGPSGSGKTHLAAHLGATPSYLHLEIDRFPHGDGIDIEGLRTEWDQLWCGASATPIAQVLTGRAQERRRAACVLSFPSGVVLPPSHISAAFQAGISVKYLYGSAAACIQAFEAREQETGRNLGVEHWLLNNSRSYLEMSRPDLVPFRVEVFATEGARPPVAEIAGDEKNKAFGSPRSALLFHVRLQAGELHRTWSRKIAASSGPPP